MRAGVTLCRCGHPADEHQQLRGAPEGVVLCLGWDIDGDGYARECDCFELRVEEEN